MSNNFSGVEREVQERDHRSPPSRRILLPLHRHRLSRFILHSALRTRINAGDFDSLLLLLVARR